MINLQIKIHEDFKHTFWESACKNFIAQQEDRFIFLYGEECHEGMMLFCKDYLHACICMELYNGVALYSDEADRECCSSENWVVVTKDMTEFN